MHKYAQNMHKYSKQNMHKYAFSKYASICINVFYMHKYA